MAKKRDSIVCVTWRDSASPVRKWHDIEDVEALGVVVCTSVGRIVHSSKEKLIVAGSWDAGHNVSELTTIPQECVVKVRKLK